MPFVLTVAALRHVPAPRVAVIATREPVLAAVFAWIIHDEALAAVQIAVGMVVLTAVAWVQTRRPDLEAGERPTEAARTQIFSSLRLRPKLTAARGHA